MTIARSVDIAIVGGGIVGASCAYFLADRDADVLLLESGRVGREASGVNAGGVRQQARALPEMSLALRSLDLWAEIDKRLESRLEYDRCGDLRIVETEADAEKVRAIASRERAVGLTLEWSRDRRCVRWCPRCRRGCSAARSARREGRPTRCSWRRRSEGERGISARWFGRRAP